MSFKSLKNALFSLYYFCLIYIVSLWFIVRQNLIPHRKSKISSQEGRIALVTGGGSGIGLETVVQLLNAGMTVIIAGLKEDEIEGRKSLQKYKDRVKFLSCDLSSLESVRHLATEFKSFQLPLHLLINNAGIMFAPQHTTDEGFESHWVINYLSHFLLTHLLLEILIESASYTKPSRIVNLSSCLHYPGIINFEDSQSRNGYLAEAAYTQSKLAMLLSSTALARRLQNNNIPVLVNAVHPAVAATKLFRHVRWAGFSIFRSPIRLILKSAAMASDTVVHAALSNEVTDGGNYYDNCRAETPSKVAQSAHLQEKLWTLSCHQAAIADFGHFA